MPEKIMIVDPGGRGHAVGWKLDQVPGRELLFAPGNAGTSKIGKNIDIGANEIDKLARFACDNNVGLTIVGPEGPLAMGIVDQFQNNERKIFGPSQEAARLETDKSWAVKFMNRHEVPHPASYIFNDEASAIGFIYSAAIGELVIKYPYLAAGKGVVLPDGDDQAIQAVKEIFKGKFGSTNEVIIQEKLSGPELSVMAFSDGKTVVPMLPAQDHKRLLDGDRGPNTGGMGAYAPVPFVSAKLMQKIHSTILQPTIDGMREEGHPYKGILYAGLMLTKDGPKVLEYNARFGDPETQPLMMLLQSDLGPILESCIAGTLNSDQVQFRKGSAACIVIASEGYPDKPKTGEIIHGLGLVDNPNVQVFHAGTIIKDGKVVTYGGRVLGVTAYAGNMSGAVYRAYATATNMHFKDMQYRTDIAAQAFKNRQKHDK